jgi:kynurenine formamidase
MALEAVANLKLIPGKGAWLFVGAPKIENATGGMSDS